MSEITLILTTYQRPKSLKNAITTVLRQTYSKFQIIVCDNGSDEETLLMMQELTKQDARIVHYRHKENIGLINNFIFGMSKVNTPFFTFLSDDDWIFPWFFEVSIHRFKEFSLAMGVINSTLVINEKKQICSDCHEKIDFEGMLYPPQGLLKILEHPNSVWSSMLFRTEIIKEIDGLDPNIGTVFDIDFIYRVITKFPVYISKLPAGVFFIQPPNKASSSSINIMLEGYKKLTQKLASNSNFEQNVKDALNKTLMDQFEKSIPYYLKVSIFQKKFQDSYKCIELIKASKNRKMFLIFMIRVLEKFPFLVRSIPIVRYLNVRDKIRFYRTHKDLKKKYQEFFAKGWI